MKKSKSQRVSFADEHSGSITARTAISQEHLSQSDSSATLENYFSSLCRFTATLPRPAWEVKFPLVLPSPKPRFSGSKSLRSIREQRAAYEASRPSTETKFRPITQSLKLQSSLALQYIDSQCEAFLSGAKRKLRKSKKELKDLKSGLKTTAKHIRLIAVSNNRAPYYVLRHKFQRLKID